MPRDLTDTTWHLLNDAAQLYADSPRASEWLRHHLDRLEEPLRVAVAGPAGSGKSTLVNALIGEAVAPLDIQARLVWYQDGTVPRARGYGSEVAGPEIPMTRDERGLSIDLSPWQGHDLDEVIVEVPSRALRHAMLVDTTERAGGLDRVMREVDALLYVARGSSLAALAESRGNAVNTIAVLGRADEVGGSGLDALASAKQLARRLHRDLTVRATCQSVVSFSGLLAHAARTLRDNEFLNLAALAAAPRPELSDLLLSVDRFTGDSCPAPVPRSTRRALIDRWGLFGVRLATTLIRTGCGTSAALSAQLVQRSGLAELRESMRQFLIGRAAVLKARSAWRALEFVVQREPRTDAQELLADLEQTLASAHELRELRLLAALRTGRVRLPEPLDMEAQRLIGGEGTDPLARLGIEDWADEQWQRRLAGDALERWRELTGNPVLAGDQRRAAEVVVRSCEAMLAG